MFRNILKVDQSLISIVVSLPFFFDSILGRIIDVVDESLDSFLGSRRLSLAFSHKTIIIGKDIRDSISSVTLHDMFEQEISRICFFHETILRGRILSDSFIPLKLSKVMIRTDDDSLLRISKRDLGKNCDDVVGLSTFKSNTRIDGNCVDLRIDLSHHIKECLPVNVGFFTMLCSRCLVIGKELLSPSILSICTDDRLTILVRKLLNIRANRVQRHMTNQVFIGSLKNSLRKEDGDENLTVVD